MSNNWLVEKGLKIIEDANALAKAEENARAKEDAERDQKMLEVVRLALGMTPEMFAEFSPERVKGSTPNVYLHFMNGAIGFTVSVKEARTSGNVEQTYVLNVNNAIDHLAYQMARIKLAYDKAISNTLDWMNNYQYTPMQSYNFARRAAGSVWTEPEIVAARRIRLKKLTSFMSDDEARDWLAEAKLVADDVLSDMISKVESDLNLSASKALMIKRIENTKFYASESGITDEDIKELHKMAELSGVLGDPDVVQGLSELKTLYDRLVAADEREAARRKAEENEFKPFVYYRISYGIVANDDGEMFTDTGEFDTFSDQPDEFGYYTTPTGKMLKPLNVCMIERRVVDSMETFYKLPWYGRFKEKTELGLMLRTPEDAQRVEVRHG